MSDTLRGVGPIGVQALVLLPDRDSPGRNDWSGAFHPEALRFARLHKVPPPQVIQIDTARPRAARLAQLLAAVEASAAINCLAIFSHGWRGGLGVGPYSQDVQVLVRALELRAYGDLSVVLYACSAGDGTEDGPAGPGGEGGFADALRDALLGAGLAGARVDAHTVDGHTSRNPYVRRFDGSTTTGGAWLVRPDERVERAWATLRRRLDGSDGITLELLRQELGGDLGAGNGLTWARWRLALRDTDLRFRFPLMTADQIRAELEQ